MALLLGDEAPNFTVMTTEGEIDFHQWVGDSWVVLFSHPADFTPVCTTEIGRAASLYGMIQPKESSTAAVRSVFIIDPDKKIRLTMTYPAAVGRNFDEILRVIDALQVSDKYGIATPVDWQKGDKVVVKPSMSTEDARKKFGDLDVQREYLRLASDPSSR